MRDKVDAPDTLRARCAALATRMPPTGAFSHSTAAVLLGLPLPQYVDAEALHLSVTPPVRTPRIAGVVGHRLTLAETDVVSLGRLTVTSWARTWRDLASQLSISDLVAVGDAIIHWRLPRASADDLVAAAAALRGRPGAPNAVAAARLVHPRAESPQESVLRVMLAEAGLPRMDVNVDLFEPSGRFVARPDLRFPDYRVIVEYEGDHHRTTRSQWRRDLRRTVELQHLGETVVRLAADDLVPATVDVLKNILRRAGWSSVATSGRAPGRVGDH